MATKSHVFFVPFPGAGHAVNTINAAVTIANPSIQAHILVLSGKKGKQWTKATGQEANPNTHLEVMGGGKWEDWDPPDTRDVVMFIKSPEFYEVVREKIGEVGERFPDDQETAIVYNILMGGMVDVASSLKLKLFILNPVAMYMWRMMHMMRETDDPKDTVILKGIGGRDEDLVAEKGDVLASALTMTPGTRPGLEAAGGIISTNTNMGLDGKYTDQAHLRVDIYENRLTNYMVGPILPPWYEKALDDEAARKKGLDARGADDECLRFMDQQPDKSVIYVALGSHAELSREQAQIIIGALRRNKTPWVLLFRDDPDAMARALASRPDTPSNRDGVVTGWSPQLEILMHPALKCVLSHGGFGTMIEGIYAGQPFITTPVVSDQFIDTRVMQHLGICVANIANPSYLSVFQMSRIIPNWPDDAEARINALFDRLFGTAAGEAELESARQASRSMRRAMMEAKATSAAQALEDLRADLSRPLGT